MKKLLLTLFAAFLLTSCSDDNDPAPPKVERAPITILAYLVADNNLNSYLYDNIGTMYEGLINLDKAATLLIYWDGSSRIQGVDTPVILRYEFDGKDKVNGKLYTDHQSAIDAAEIVKEYPDQFSTDKNVMSKVLKDMVSLSTTAKIGLIAGSHGSAWTNSIYFSRSFGQDGHSTDNTILTSDMAEAMKSTGRVFDFLLFDACVMGTAEVCYDFKDVANYQLVSVMEIPSYGCPYDMMLDNLYAGNVAGYTQSCTDYIDYYKSLYETSSSAAWGTMALVNSSKMNDLSDLIKEQLQVHKEVVSTFDPLPLQEYGRNAAEYIAFDLTQFIQTLNEGKLPSDFNSCMNDLVIYADCLSEARYSYYDYDVDPENFCGLGIYIPCSKTKDWYKNFKDIAWYSAAGWNEITYSWSN